jgi:DNA-binding FadR family transcriptional regulator
VNAPHRTAPVVDLLTRSRVSRSEALAERLATRIRDEQLPYGNRLGTKEDLRAAYGVAPSTVNEALRLLRADGAVEVRSGPGGGVFVASGLPFVRLGHKVLGTRHEAITVADCIAVRNVLEAAVMEEATRHASSADVAELRALVDTMERGVNDNLTFARANWALHRRLAAISPNRVLWEVYTRLLDFIESETTEIVADTDYSELGAYRIDVHSHLVEAVASGDLEAAAKAERAHRAFAENAPGAVLPGAAAAADRP